MLFLKLRKAHILINSFEKKNVYVFLEVGDSLIQEETSFQSCYEKKKKKKAQFSSGLKSAKIISIYTS